MKTLLIAVSAATLLTACDLGAAQSARSEAAVPTAAARLVASGAWSPPAEIVPGSRQDQCPLYQNPAVTRRGDGLVAVWLARTGADVGRFHWAELAPGATAWSVPQSIGEQAQAYFQDDAAQLVTLSDGSIVAFWLFPESASERRMMTATLPASATRWTAPAPAPEPLSRHIRAAAGADGGLHIVYGGPQGPTYARRDRTGAWSPGEPLRNLVSRTVTVEMMGGPNQQVRTSGGSPMVAVGPDGAVLVAWWDNQLTLNPMGALARDLMWRVRGPDGRWSRSRRFDAARSEHAEDSALTADASGFLLLFAGADRQGRLARLPQGAESWTAPQPIGEGRLFEPQFSSLGPGGAVLAQWRGFVPGRGSHFALAGSNGAGGLRPLPSPPADGFDLFAHAAGIDSAGRLVALFDDPEEPQGCAGLAWSMTTG